MGREGQKAKEKARLQAEFEGMWEELWQWREAHPEATMDEIVRQVTPRRRTLMGDLVVQLAKQAGSGGNVKGLVCEQCGEGLEDKGEPKREGRHLEGGGELSRTYFYCDRCTAGLFPPGSTVGAG